MPTYRRATVQDIPRVMEIRFAVQENRLHDPTSVTPADCEAFIARGLIWVAEEQGRVIGFSAGNDRDGTIWALFVDPVAQGRGLGADLLALACRDLAAKGYATARLTTDPGTRADRFYRRNGWMDRGLDATGAVRFERPL